MSYAAAYYDAADRLTAAVDVGTNGGTAWTQPGTVPARSSTVLVTSTAYDPAGNVQDVVDPLGLDTRTSYDALGRVTKTVEDYTDGVVTSSSNQTTVYTYNAAGVTSLTAELPGGGGQTTASVYGVTTGGGSGVNSNDVVGATEYPDPTTGAASTSQKDTVTVNALGEMVTSTDRTGTTHTYTYDVLGRVTVDAVTALGAGVDGSVRRVEVAYSGQSQPYQITSYNAVSGGSIVNQVQDDFNGLGQLITEWQSHAGAVSFSATPKVQYAYSFNASGSANNSRLTTLTYPDGHALTYTYTGGSNSGISRLSSFGDAAGVVEGYLYLGLSTVVERDRPQTGMNLSYIDPAGGTGSAGDQYTGLDQFGRVVNQLWANPTTGVYASDQQYGYDADGNVAWMMNGLNAAFGELYSYDGLNQLTGFERGTVIYSSPGVGLSGSPSASASWNYDAVGNRSSVTANGSTTTYGANAQNEYTSVSGATTPGYDAAGNLTTDETGRQFVYDGWGRLVTVKSSAGAVLETLTYDGLGRAVTSTAGGTTTDRYYSDAGQVLEERVGSAYTTRYIWSPDAVNGLVARDTDTTGTGLTATGTGYQRLFAVDDANGDIVALVNTSGVVVERYAYDPYGTATVMNGTWSTIGGSAYSWVYTFQGMRYDSVSGLNQAEYRWYSPTLGRWTQNDPIGFAGGDVNTYRMEGDGPVDRIDPTGLDTPYVNGTGLYLKRRYYITIWSNGGDYWLGTVVTINGKEYVKQGSYYVERGKVEDWAKSNGGTVRKDPNAVLQWFKDNREDPSQNNVTAGSMAGRAGSVAPEACVDSTYLGFQGVDRGQTLSGLQREALKEARSNYVEQPLMAAALPVAGAIKGSRSGVNPTTAYRAGATRPPRHHVFPQAQREWFRQRGVDIDRYTLPLDEGTHQALHYGGGPGKGGGWWNNEIMKRLNDAEAALGRELTNREVIMIGKQMRDQYTPGVKVIPYDAP